MKFAQSEQAARVWQAGLRAMAPPEDLTVSEWAEKYLELSPRFTAFPGPIKLDRTPYLREPLDAFGLRSVRELTICAAAQVAKTTFLMACLGYAIDQDPGPILFVMPSADLCKSFSEQRLGPLLEDCSRLARHLPADVRKRRLLEIPFTNDVQMALVGANSPANLASRPVRYPICDETDKYPGANAREASALALIEKRLRTFWNSKFLKASTPTTTVGEIWRSFLRGDQRFLWVPCPHCKNLQPLVFGSHSLFLGRYNWENVGKVIWDQDARKDNVWDLDAVRASARYECGHCKNKIPNAKKAWMIRNGEWRPEAINVRHRSYHLSALYALWPSCSFGELAVDFLEAKGEGQDGLQDFTNSTLGEPWEILGDAADEDEILAHRGDYPRGSCPIQPLAAVITADVQRNECYWVVRAYGAHGTRWTVDYGVAPSIDALADIGRQPWKGPTQDFFCHAGFVDSGDQTDKVYRFCEQHRWTPLKGYRERVQPIQWGPGFGGQLLNIDTGYFKDSFQINLWNDVGSPGSWNLPANAGQEFATHLTAESKIRERSEKTGRISYVWKQIREANHWLDCEVYQEAVCLAFNLDRLEEQQPDAEPQVQTKRRRDGRDWFDRSS